METSIQPLRFRTLRSGDCGRTMGFWLQTFPLSSPCRSFLAGPGSQVVGRVAQCHSGSDFQPQGPDAPPPQFTSFTSTHSAVSPPRLCRRLHSPHLQVRRYIFRFSDSISFSTSPSFLRGVVGALVLCLSRRYCHWLGSSCISHPFLRGEKRAMYSLWSFLLWFLFAMILTGLAYPVWRVSQAGRRAILGCIPSVSQPSLHLRSELRLAGRQKRQMKWISFDEFMTLLRKQSADLVVIDLSADAPWVPFPVPTVLLLPVTPHDLIRVLEWLLRTGALCSTELPTPVFSRSRQAPAWKVQRLFISWTTTLTAWRQHEHAPQNHFRRQPQSRVEGSSGAELLHVLWVRWIAAT